MGHPRSLYGARALYDRYPYDDSCRAYSDDNTTRLHYYISREVRPCGGLYYYRQHEASVTHKAGLRHFDYLRANESMRRQLIDLAVGDDVLRRYENQRCWCSSTAGASISSTASI